ncbi:hypothetical protein HYW17_01520 [Candidatus Uhrbacteria bacterium]|nr:hypothetical protein [Candidatus Uhrbacteria bacterium]
MEKLLPILKTSRKFIVFFALVTASVAAAISLVLPFKYSASVRLLITQKEAFTLDPYTALRSNELIGDSLAQVVATSTFLSRILESGYKIDPRYFDKAEHLKRRLWDDTVEVDVARGTGLVRITAFHPDRDQAKRIVAASAFLLSAQGSDYVGRELTVRLVDPPLASKFPVRPNLPLNAVVGGILGAFLASGWVWLDHRRKKHHGHLL